MIYRPMGDPHKGDTRPAFDIRYIMIRPNDRLQDYLSTISLDYVNYFSLQQNVGSRRHKVFQSHQEDRSWNPPFLSWTLQIWSKKSWQEWFGLFYIVALIATLSAVYVENEDPVVKNILNINNHILKTTGLEHFVCYSEEYISTCKERILF